jgi:hypothetical protein
MLLELRISLIDRLELLRARTYTLETLPLLLVAIMTNFSAGLTRPWVSKSSVNVRRSGTAADGVCGLLELITFLHADGWDFQIVLRFESPVCWCCACWKSFRLELGYLVVADEDAWSVLLTG